MALQLVNKGWDMTRKRKRSVFVLAALGATGYGVYKAYNSPSVVRKRKRLFKLVTAFVYLAEAVSNSAEVVGILSNDLREFIHSDSDEIPNSLRQMSKIAHSKEFSDSIVRLTAALTRGVFRGYQAESKGDDGVDSGSGFYDQFMDKLFSDAGKGFASVVIGSFAKNMVMGFYSSGEFEGQANTGKSMGVDGQEEAVPRWVEMMCNDQCREVVGECIQKFVSTAVDVYLEKTMHMNTYDDLFAGLTNPKHEKQVKDLLVSVCNGSIETLVKTSHKVLTSSKSGSSSKSSESNSCADLSRFVVTRSNSDILCRSFFPEVDDAHNLITVKHSGLGRGGGDESRQKKGWASTMSSTLAVPSNRKLMLDVTGKVTFMTVRSFLEFLVEKVVSTVRASVDFVNEAIIERGIRVVRYMTAQTSVFATVCLSLCLHIFGGTSWALMPV